MKRNLLLLGFLLPVLALAQTTRNAGTAAELNAAITASANGDIINITNNIVTSSEVVLNKTLIINGNDYTISVPIPGLDEMGRFNTSPSAFRVFSITTTGTNVTINNLTIIGGTPAASGGAINIASSTSLRLNRCIVTRSRANSGGGITNAGGVLYLNQTYIIRNAATFAGGLLNTGSTARAYIESSTMVENRSTGAGSGGGAVENASSAIIYFNNSTLSNNQSTEIGGAINNFTGTVFFVNSSATGNVCFGASASTGGAIGNNNGTVRIVNSLLAHNYRRTTGTAANPTGYVLDDIRAWNGQANVHVYFSILHANLTSGIITANAGLNGTLGTNTSNISYTGAANGSDNTIFSGGILTRITDNNGTEIGDPIFRPFLLNNAGGVAPTLQPASFVLSSANRGTRTRFANNNNVNPVVAYWDGSAWVNLAGTSAAGQEVLADQININRPNPPARGAMEGVASNLFMVKVNVSADGTVSGGTFQGDVYPSGTAVTLTAIPNASRAFLRWERTDVTPVTTYSTSNPLSFTVTENITLRPVFSTLSAGQFTITYAGNGNTGGAPPASGTFSSSTTVANGDGLTRTGFTFTGWNTNANGSGTAYAAGASYAGPANLTLFAQWQEQVNTWNGASGTLWAVVSSWTANNIAPNNARVRFASNATDHLSLEQHRAVRRLEFNGAARHMVLGNHNLSVSESISDFGSTSHVRTNGSGRLVLSINPSQTRIFPVGNSSYNPLTILNRTGRNEEFSVNVMDEVYVNGAGGTVFTTPRVRRTWNISNTFGNTQTGDGIDMTFNWNAGDGSGVAEPALFHFENNTWNRVTGDITISGNSLTIRGYKGTFSPFAILDASTTLPVTWHSFTARCNGNTTLLQWSTASEQDNSHFVVERNTSGNWQAIAQVQGRGTTAQLQQYQYVDAFSGTARYRLRQVDFNGRQQFSTIVSVRCSEAGPAFRIFPNPASEQLTISGAQPGSRYRLLNSTGQPVREGVVLGLQQQVDVRQLPAGAYYLQLIDANGQRSNEAIRIQ